MFPRPSGHEPDASAALAQYRRRADRYDLELAAFEPLRIQAIDALQLHEGDTVLDVGCGTGLSFALLRERIGAQGWIVGIEQSPQMLDQARRRIPALPRLDEEHVEQDGTVVVQLWAHDGRLLADTWPIPGLMLQQHEGFHDLDLDGHAWRVYTAASASPQVQVVQSGDFRRRVALHSAQEAAEPVAILIPVTVLLLWLVVWLALRPLERLAQALGTQDERNLSELPLHQVPAELEPLVLSMNSLLLRLKEAFATRQRFVQDAAHELRTPLTALKLQVENLRQEAAAPEIARLQAGIERMQRLVEQLLRLARQEAAASDAAEAAVEVTGVLKQSLESFVPLAAARRIDLGLVATESAQIRVDVHDLRSVLDNLLDNALHYTPAGGRVDVSLQWVDEILRLEVLDSGPGIPPELLDRVFDRFYRVPGNGAEGSGLGLAIARHAAERAGLRIELCNRAGGSGLAARVWFKS